MEGGDRQRKEEVEKRARAIIDAWGEKALPKLFEVHSGGFDPLQTDFDTREQMVVDAIKELGAMLLLAQCEKDPRLQPIMAAKEWLSPCCKKPCPRKMTDEGEPAFLVHKLESKAGVIEIRMPLFWCQTHRKSFSPLPTLPESRP